MGSQQVNAGLQQADVPVSRTRRAAAEYLSCTVCCMDLRPDSKADVSVVIIQRLIFAYTNVLEDIIFVNANMKTPPIIGT
jgi:hypothetical protein